METPSITATDKQITSPLIRLQIIPGAGTVIGAIVGAAAGVEAVKLKHYGDGRNDRVQ